VSARTFTVTDLQRAAWGIAEGVKSATDELNNQDGKLGDGDLGITVSAGWQAVADIRESLPADVGRAFLASAKARSRNIQWDGLKFPGRKYPILSP
jgi:dihydroxyacetone kinase-like protein